MSKLPAFPDLKITLGPRPGKKSLKRLQDLQLTHCCTLLSAREDAELIRKISKNIGTEERPCDWIWLPMEGGNLEVLRQTDMQTLFKKLHDAIGDKTDAHIYFHCSAGIHRTGFFTYILLRLLGRDGSSAETELAQLRLVTSEQVGPERIELAEEFASRLLDMFETN